MEKNLEDLIKRAEALMESENPEAEFLRRLMTGTIEIGRVYDLTIDIPVNCLFCQAPQLLEGIMQARATVVEENSASFDFVEKVFCKNCQKKFEDITIGLNNE